MLDALDATAAHRWCAIGLAALRRHQKEIDALNVYPVPDGDTGTNLVATLAAAAEALSREPDGNLGLVLHRMARGALMGARGNSGVIVSQLLRGLADTLVDVPVARGRALADALTAAAKAAYAAVAKPMEGTVLSVAHAAALAATAADSDDLEGVIRVALREASAALARTPEQLPALARAGVVDAGGRGLVVLLDALLEVVTGQVAPSMPVPAAQPVARPPEPAVFRESGSDEFGYEVQYLLDADVSALDALRETLDALGDSLVIVGAGGHGTPIWNVHVHVNDVGAAIEAGIEAGRPHRISVTRFADQIAANQAAGLPAPGQTATGQTATGTLPAAHLEELLEVRPDPEGRAVVVVSGGSGLTDLFLAEGARVVDGGASFNPSTAEVLTAIRATGAGRVVVLPNDSNVHAVAAAAADEARAAGVRVGVVPTRSPVQALAALAVRDPGRRFNDDLIAMAEAAGACRYAEVTVATKEALTVAGRCQAGDVLALIEGEVSLIGPDLTGTCVQLLDRLLAGGGELVTLILGADAPAELSSALTRHVAFAWPFVEVQAYEGGQPHFPLLVGVE